MQTKFDRNYIRNNKFRQLSFPVNLINLFGRTGKSAASCMHTYNASCIMYAYIQCQLHHVCIHTMPAASCMHTYNARTRYMGERSYYYPCFTC